ALPDGQRAELIDGRLYIMAPPKMIHPKLATRVGQLIATYIDSHKGKCEVFVAPFAVFLNQNENNYVEPDISVICDKDKINDEGCNGAPDWIIEIVSPSTSTMDYGVKLFKYRTSGVREYWIVNPLKNIVNVYDFEHDEKSNLYSFDEKIPVCIYTDFSIRIADLL
ncbi:MAG: Uma2 family endonuclease, partial [Lachnospiraceae bacterium]|nr:Uma2 family endonuclease [Lachnospiraceae bacterium]